MSDESQPPPLRLRPRARTEEAVTMPSANPVSPPSPQAEPVSAPISSAVPAAEEPVPRLRLKPKLTVEAEPEGAVSTMPVSEPALFLPAAAKAVEACEPATESSEMPRLKLKPLQPSADVVPAAFPANIPPAPVDAADDMPDLPQAANDSHPEQPALRPLPVVKVDASPPLSITGVLGGEQAFAPFKPPAKASRLSVVRLAVIFAALAIIAGGGYYAYRIFLVDAPGPPPAIVVKKAPAPPVVVASLPVPPPAPPVSVPVKQVVSDPILPVVPVKAAPVKPLSPPTPVVLAPSVEFLTWVDTAKISGVFNGSPPRAIVNGLLVRPGDAIDASRGIVFDHVDADQKEFFFRDRSGAVTSKSY